MKPRTRLWIVALTAPLVAFTVVGGYLGRLTAQDGAYRHLRVFDDVVQLISSSYVEEVDLSKVMQGAMHGLAEGLDGDSAYLTPEQVRAFGRETGSPGEVGLVLSRQYYLRVVAVHDQSPAARAGLRPDDFIRTIDGRPTRETSAIDGARQLRGEPGSTVRLTVIRGNTADPHEVTLTRERPDWPAVTGRLADGGTAVLRIASFPPRVADPVRDRLDALVARGATQVVLDVRNAAAGAHADGLAVARLFVPRGTLAVRDARDGGRTPVDARSGDGRFALPLVLLVDGGTAGPAELLAAALSGARKAELVGERTAGRTAEQRLIALPDGGGFWLSHAWYLTPSGQVIHGRGLPPDVGVEVADVEFGERPAARDAILDKGLERIAARPPAARAAR